MVRDLAQPFDAGVLHGDVRIEAPGDGAGYKGGAFLLKQIDQPLHPRNQRIDRRRLASEEFSDGNVVPASQGTGLGSPSYRPV